MSWGLGLALAGAGGGLGALLRWLLIDLLPADLWVTAAINVLGSVVLVLLPAATVIRARPALAILFGTGTMGGFTTMSGSVALADGTQGWIVFALTAALALALVRVLGTHVTAPAARRFEAAGGDE